MAKKVNTARQGTIFGILLLLITSLIWGTAFVAQSSAMDHIGPLTMNGLRCAFATVFLCCIIPIFDRINGKKPSVFGTNDKGEIKTLLKGGLLMGVFVTVASTLQQIGIIYTTVGKSGFLTALYIVIVPLMGLFLKKRIKINGWIAVVLALIGMYLLCINGELTINKGDLAVIIGSIFFAIHMLVIDKYSQISDPIRLSCLQFAVCTVVCLLFAFIFENPEWQAIKSAFFNIFYAGVFSAGIGYTLQVIGQKFVPVNVAPLIMSLESVFSVLAGVVFLNETMTPIEIIGCVFIFIAIIVAQITISPKEQKTANEQIAKGQDAKDEEFDGKTKNNE